MSTSISATIMEFLNNLFGGDEEARQAFLDNPEGYLAANGLDHLSCADFDDALVSFFENAEFENEKDGHDLSGKFENTVAHPGQSDHEAIAEHLTKIVHEYGDTYITNNDNDVVNDSSFQGNIFAGGDVDFDNSIVSASGDGAVAAGGDVDDVVTGDGNVVGDDNQVGDGAFGAGSVAGGVNVDDGGAFANNGSTASGSQDDNSDNSDNSVSNEDSFNDNSSNDDNSDNSIDDSFNPDNSLDVDVDDSGNDNSSNDNNSTNDNSTTTRVDVDLV